MKELNGSIHPNWEVIDSYKKVWYSGSFEDCISFIDGMVFKANFKIV